MRQDLKFNLAKRTSKIFLFCFSDFNRNWIQLFVSLGLASRVIKDAVQRMVFIYWNGNSKLIFSWTLWLEWTKS